MRRPTSSVLLTGALAALLTFGTAGFAAAAPTTSTAAGPWAAIAVDPYSGALGYVWNYGSRDAAAGAARGQCGADGCTGAVEVANGCASLAQASSGRLGWAYGRPRAATPRASRGARSPAVHGSSRGHPAVPTREPRPAQGSAVVARRGGVGAGGSRACSASV